MKSNQPEWRSDRTVLRFGDGSAVYFGVIDHGAEKARLASAAPELLFALKNLMAERNGERDVLHDAGDIARIAIAKAEGRS